MKNHCPHVVKQYRVESPRKDNTYRGIFKDVQL